MINKQRGIVGNGCTEYCKCSDNHWYNDIPCWRATVGASAGVSTVVINAASSGKVLKINALTAAAIGSTTGVTLNYYDTAGRHTAAISTVSLGTTVNVPTNSSLILISKENSFYLEGRQIGVTAQSNAGTLDVICSYEEITRGD